MRASRTAFRGQAVLHGCSVDVGTSSLASVTGVRIRGLLESQGRIATSAPASSSIS